jgi:parallel beta-helix repeat protein
MIGPNWSKGWIIENNIFHDAKCSAISLGKEISTGQNFHFRFRRKSGYQYQQEAVFLALRAGWSKDTVGSHIVRNNIIHDCGQAGIVGHMGGAFSRIEHNHIYNVNNKQEFWGHEIAGIKLHAAVDTVIENNNIHDCNLGIWLDWEAQGTRVTKNLFFKNVRDIMIEVTHGPCLVDNNLFLSTYTTIQEAAQGTAYVHNILAGPMLNYKVVDRATPYHYPHTTDVAGYAFTYGGDYRFINNMLIGTVPCSDSLTYSEGMFEKYSTPEEYMPAIMALGSRLDHDKYFNVPQPDWVEENAYSGYAKPYSKEVSPVMGDGMDLSLEEKDDEWILHLKVPAAVANYSCREVSTERLGTPRITEEQYEAPDGTPIDFSVDMVGNVRGEHIVPGAIAGLCEGMNTITVWRENRIYTK